MNGILLVNLGTPEAPTAAAVRPYLERFLSDKRVIDTPDYLWQPILRTMILPKRPAKSAALYRQIWLPEGSPLALYTQQQATALQQQLPDCSVRYAMSYSQPDIKTQLAAFEHEGITDLTVIPLYPQYSGTTIGSVFDDVLRFYQKRTTIPSLHLLAGYYQNPLYLKALAGQLDHFLTTHSVDTVLFSYHGLPKRYVEAGDPYRDQCHATTIGVMALVQHQVSFSETFQSRFGPDEWLTPATDTQLKNWPKNGVKRVAVIAPSFASDCLETLYELNIENRHYFMEAGGESFFYLPALNDAPVFTKVLKQLYQTSHS